LSGVEILEDIAQCLVEGLRNNCDLRASDAFASYAAKITVELYLHDTDTQKLDKSIIVGEPASLPPTHTATVEMPLASADEVRERSDLTPPSMEIAADGSRVQEPAKRRTRFYAPRRSKLVVSTKEK
jgi:hypothetical protein